MLVLNDLHVGFSRTGGTTPASREALRSYLLSSIERMLTECTEDRLMILGDLFDDFDVSVRDWIEAYRMLGNWLRVNGARQLILVAGNHDHSPKGERVSAFQLLCRVLIDQFGDHVEVIGIDQWDCNEHEAVLAHCSNQTVFNEKLAELLELAKPGWRVFLHANWDNNFAVESDHSLNVSREQGKAFAAKGATLYFAHVHQAKTDLGGSVVVLGNQWPTSISDCLGNDDKFAHIFRGSVTKIKTWDRGGGYPGLAEFQWNDLFTMLDTSAGFVRVVGTATASQASEVVSAISKFRQTSGAFVITNAVKVEGIADAQDLPENFEAAKRFDVMSYVREHLNAEETGVVEELLKEAEQ